VAGPYIMLLAALCIRSINYEPGHELFPDSWPILRGGSLRGCPEVSGDLRGCLWGSGCKKNLINFSRPLNVCIYVRHIQAVHKEPSG